ncbi:MAG: CRISPR-associated CARF protein Csa3 [Candidatus Jordarchaeales archaeon]
MPNDGYKIISSFNSLAEILVIRAIMRNAPLKEDKVIVFVPSFKDERVERALSSLKEFCAKIGGLRLEEQEVPVTDVEGAIAKVYRVLGRELMEGRKLCFNLSGGMRVLILEVLAAALAVLRSMPETKVEVELENLMGRVEFSLNHFMLSQPSTPEKDILSCIAELEEKGKVATLNALTSTLKEPRTTLYRKLLDLADKGYVKVEKLGRSMFFTLTSIGRIFL